MAGIDKKIPFTKVPANYIRASGAKLPAGELWLNRLVAEAVEDRKRLKRDRPASASAQRRPSAFSMIRPTFEQALLYLVLIRDTLIRKGENEEATVVAVGTDIERPQYSPFVVYYGYPPVIPKEHSNLPYVDISREDDADVLWRSAYALVNPKETED